MHEYDSSLKHLLQGSANRLILELTDAGVERWVNVEFKEVRGGNVDLLGETPEGGLVHIELQSTNEPLMHLRMAEYCLMIYRQLRQFPKQIVLYVGDEPLRMESQLVGPDYVFRYRLVDIRELDGDRLLESPDVGDNVVAILAGLRDRKQGVRQILGRIAGLQPGEREIALRQLTILAGLRKLGGVILEATKDMPILNDILDHDLLGPEFKRGLKQGEEHGLEQGMRQGRKEGEREILRRQITKRFGSFPEWASEQLERCSSADLEDLSLRLLDALTLDDLLRRP